MCVFKFGAASPVAVLFPPHAVVGVHGSGDTHVSWVFFIFSSQTETSPNPLNLVSLSPQTVNNPSSSRSLCPGFLGCGDGGKMHLCFFGICEGRRSGGDRSDRLSDIQGSPPQSQSNLNKRSTSANKYSRQWCVGFQRLVDWTLLGYYLDTRVVMIHTTPPICKHYARNIAGGIRLIASHGQEAGHERRALCKDGRRGDSHQKCPWERLPQGLMGKQEITADPVCRLRRGRLNPQSLLKFIWERKNR